MVTALSKFWQHTPPPIIQLKRIGQALGVNAANAPEKSVDFKPQTFNQNDINDLGAALGGIAQGRPNDPMLDFLDVDFKVKPHGE